MSKLHIFYFVKCLKQQTESIKSLNQFVIFHFVLVYYYSLQLNY